MRNIYVDTNIFLDFWLDRSSRVQPLGLFAKKLFDEARECRYFLIVSTSTLKEIELNVKFPEVVEEFFEGFMGLGKLKVVKVDNTLLEKARQLEVEWVPVHDRVHALVAKQEKAIIVSRDEHFKQLEDFLKIEVRTPEQL